MQNTAQRSESERERTEERLLQKSILGSLSIKEMELLYEVLEFPARTRGCSLVQKRALGVITKAEEMELAELRNAKRTSAQ